MDTMNLSGKLPEDTNGLHRIGAALVDDPKVVRLAVVEFDVSKVVTDIGSGGRTPTLRILSIEPVVERDEVLRLQALLLRERRRRTAVDPMPGQLDLLEHLANEMDTDGGPDPGDDGGGGDNAGV